MEQRTVDPLGVDVDRLVQVVDAHLVLGAAVVAQDRTDRVLEIHLAGARLRLAAEGAVEDLRDLRLGLLRRRHPGGLNSVALFVADINGI